MFFLLGMFSLIAMVGALNMAYPGSPGQEFPHGALAVRLADVRSLPQDARSYIWLHWFGKHWSFGSRSGCGLGKYRISSTRRRHGVIPSRVGTPGIAENHGRHSRGYGFCRIVGRSRYPLAAGLRGSVTPGPVVLSTRSHGSVSFGSCGSWRVVCPVCVFLCHARRDGEGNSGMPTLFLFGMFTFLVDGVQRYSIYRLMTGDMYFLKGEIPWLAIAVSVCASLLLIAGSLAIVERRDY